MKFLPSPWQTSGNRTSRTTQRPQTPVKTIVDNRPSAAIQRKLQEIANIKGVLQIKPTRGGLPEDLKKAIENYSGYSLDDVKVHYNSSKPAEVEALAYAQGNDIYLAPGQEKHLAHEAWHVVQQKQGRVRPTLQMDGGIKLNDDKRLEDEAERMATQASKSVDEQPFNLGRKLSLNTNITSVLVVQRVTTQILQGSQKDGLSNIAIVGRPVNTFSGSKGDHTTAFTTLQVGIESMLSGKSVHDASLLMANLANDLYRLPGMQLRDFLPEPHRTRLEEALTELKSSVAYFAKWRRKNAKKQQLASVEPYPVDENEMDEETTEPGGASDVGAFQRLINAYLEARELVPLSTINTKAISAPLAGKGKGESARLLATVEKAGKIEGNTEKDAVIKTIVGLFDARAAALVITINDEAVLTKMAPGVINLLDGEDRFQALAKQHLMSLESLYPKTMEALWNTNAYSTIYDTLRNAIQVKIDENTKAASNAIAEKNKRGGARADDKRYVAAGITVDKDNRIQAIQIEGRSKSPFSNTMGAHTTAWTVLTDSIWTSLIGKELPDAAAELLDLISDALNQLESFTTVFDADSKQRTHMYNAYNALDVVSEKLKLFKKKNPDSEIGMDLVQEFSQPSLDDTGMIEELSPWDQVLVLQQGIVELLNFINSIPGVSLYVGNTNGDREGFCRNILLSYCHNATSVDPGMVRNAILGLLDIERVPDHIKVTRKSIKSDEVSGYTYPEVDEWWGEQILTGKKPSGDVSTAYILLLKHHLEMIEKAYPGAIDYAKIDKENGLEKLLQERFRQKNND